MEAGKLNTKTLIYQDNGTSLDSRGQVVISTTLLGTVWASFEPITGEEAFLHEKLNAAISHRVRFRNASEIANLRTENWLVFADDTTRRFDIHEILNVDDWGKEFSLLCGEQKSVNPITS